MMARAKWFLNLLILHNTDSLARNLLGNKRYVRKFGQGALTVGIERINNKVVLAFCKAICVAAAALGLFGAASGADAATTWDLASTGTSSGGSTGLSSLGEDTTSSPSYGNQWAFTSGGQTLNAMAFWTCASGDSNCINTHSAITANNMYTGALVQYSGLGLGVTSTSTPAVTYHGNPTIGSGASFGDVTGSAPGHTVDNQGAYEFVAFQLPASNYRVTSITLNTFNATGAQGGTSTDGCPGSPCNSGDYASGNADFTVFVGNSLSSLTQLGSLSGTSGVFSGTYDTTNTDVTGAGISGFTMVSSCCNNAGSTSTITANISGGLTGRYIIIASSLTNGNRNDDFKIASLTANTVAVGEPASLLLTGIAGTGTLYLRRRRRRGA
jgi:hypothetical protein